MKQVYWSRRCGEFVNPETGKVVVGELPMFTGTVREWYETLVATIDLASKKICGHYDESMDIVAHPDVYTILQMSVSFHPAKNLCAGDYHDTAGHLGDSNLRSVKYQQRNVISCFIPSRDEKFQVIVLGI
jgi:hypothetical protein